MPAFAYRAADRSGATTKGILEASSPAAARAALRDRELLPLSVIAATERSPVLGGVTLPRLRPVRITARQLATLTRQISTLVGSDIPVEESLRLVAQQAEAPAVGSVLLEVRGAILDGRSLATALGQHPRVFPEYYRASVAAGEQSGRLGSVLGHLAHFVETRQGNAQKLQLALLYPALLAAVSAGMMVLMMIYVVPDIVKVFVSRGAELPFLTRALIAMSAGIQNYGLYAALGLLLAVLVIGRWARVPANRLRIDRFLSERPPFRRFSRQLNAARFAGSLATLVESAVPLVEALHAAAAVTPNRGVRDKVRGVAARAPPPTAMRGTSNCITSSHWNGSFGSKALSRLASAAPLIVSSTVRPPGFPSARPPRSVSPPVIRQSAAKPSDVSDLSGAQSQLSVDPPATPTAPCQIVPSTPVRHGRFLNTTLAGIVATRAAT